MNQMNNEQALQVIKQILDVASQRGVFTKLEDSNIALQALQVISNALKNVPVPNNNGIHKLNKIDEPQQF